MIICKSEGYVQISLSHKIMHINKVSNYEKEWENKFFFFLFPRFCRYYGFRKVSSFLLGTQVYTYMHVNLGYVCMVCVLIHVIWFWSFTLDFLLITQRELGVTRVQVLR